MNLMSDSFTVVPLESLRGLIAFNYEDIHLGVLDHYLLESIKRFARKTKYIRRTLKISSQAGVTSYILSDIEGYSILSIEQVTVNGVCIDHVDKCCSEGGYTYDQGRITFNCIDPCSEISIDVAVVPETGQCEVDADVVNLWGDTIANGANSRLMMSNDKRWANKSLSRVEERSFLIGVDEALVYLQTNGVSEKVYHAKTIKANKVYEKSSDKARWNSRSAASFSNKVW